MTKDWGQRNKLYAPSTGAISDFINYVLKINTAEVPADAKPMLAEITKHFERIFCRTKPLSGQMLIGGKAVEKDFYQENEWRYVPANYDIFFREDLEANRDEKNAELEKHTLAFLPSDVKYIFVKTDSEIPAIVDFIQNNLGHWPLNEIKILTSRITSLETIAQDL